MLSLQDQNKNPNSPHLHWESLPVSQKLLGISLLLFVFVLPATLLIVTHTTELRDQAQVIER